MPYASFDLETHLSRRAEFAPKIACGVWAEMDDSGNISPGTIGLRAAAVDKFRSLIQRQDVTLINQFFPYDLACVLEELTKQTEAAHASGCDSPYGAVFGRYGSVPRLVVETWNAMRAGRFIGVDICQMLLDVARGILDQREHHGYSLATVARWNEIDCPDKESTWRLFYSQLEDIAPELWPAPAREYLVGKQATPEEIAAGSVVGGVGGDAGLPLQIYARQMKENQRWIDSYGHPVLHEAGQQTWAQTCLYFTSAHGVPTSPARVEALRTKTEEHIAKLRGRLQEAGLVRPDGSRDTKACKARVRAAFDAQGQPTPMTVAAKNRKAKSEFKPQVSTEEDTMILSGDKLLIDYADYSSSSTLLTRVEDLAKGYELPLNVAFTSIRSTGRTSARKPREPHVGVQSQNDGQDSGTRECRQPREGCAFLWGDMKAAESHTLAQNCNDEVKYTRLGELLNAGVDPHAWFAGIARLGLTGMSDREVAETVLARDDSKALRDWSKPSNFGKPGGMGIEKFRIFSQKQYRVLFTEEEARHYDKLWFRAFPEVKDLHGVVKRLLGRNETCTVRIKRGGFVAGGKHFTAACNFFFQAPCAAGLKAALCHVLYECYADPNSPLWGFRCWNTVHDEICLEGPIDRIHDAGMRLREIMEREFNFYTPDYLTEAEVVAGDVWSKNAKPVFRNAGGKCKATDPGARLSLWIYEDFLAAKAAKKAAALAAKTQPLAA